MDLLQTVSPIRYGKYHCIPLIISFVQSTNETKTDLSVEESESERENVKEIEQTF
jgi:hypothetical protein